jgi:hypothetical protein
MQSLPAEVARLNVDGELARLGVAIPADIDEDVGPRVPELEQVLAK